MKMKVKEIEIARREKVREREGGRKRGREKDKKRDKRGGEKRGRGEGEESMIKSKCYF